jgi:hypothetical protein
MIEWWTETLNSWGLTWTNVFLGVGLFVITFVGSILLLRFLVIRLPADYFSESASREQRHWMVQVGKNLLGVLLIALGVVLSLPGLPGQGVMTIVIGLMLVDFPGKRRLMQWLLSHRKLLDPVNRLRHRHGQAPFVLN